MTQAIRVLHLEDSPRDAEIIRDRLTVEGLCCNILLTEDQNSYETALKTESFDLIISDYNLPGYDGTAALEQAQAIQPDVPVILISGTVGEEQAVKCLHIGATDYLLKERLERLVPAVERALREATTRRTRKNAEAALSQSEARKAAILDSVLDCIVTMDARGLVIEFNAAAVRTFGYSKSEAVGRLLADLIIPPAFRESHRAGLARAVASDGAPLLGKLIEITAMRSDGTHLPVELTITAVGSGNDSIFTGVLRDITARIQALDVVQKRAEDLEQQILERKVAETALRGERDRAQSYLDTAEVILLSVDLKGRITLVNRYGCSLLGFPVDELLGRDFIGTFTPARLRAVLRIKFQNLIRGDLSIVENPILTKSGEERLIEWRNTLLRDDAGEVVGTFSSGTDITASSEAAESLRKAEERMRFALEAADAGIWEVDYGTGVVRWSTILELQYGLEPGVFGGTLEAFMNCIHPDDRRSVTDTIAAATVSGEDFSLLNRAIWPDGTVRWLSAAGRVQLDEERKPVRGFGISLDVTERRRLEDQYQQAQKMEAVGRLAAGVAHDFNNLLSVILGYCELLLVDPKCDSPRVADIREIQKAGAQAAGLTRQLLAFSRKEIIQPALLDMNVIVTDLRVMLERLIGEDVRVVLRLGRALPNVKADRSQTEQVVLNLAVNARDAMPNGGTLTIETASVTLDKHRAKRLFVIEPGDYMALTVSDTGTGMTTEVQARLFEPFFTTKELGKGTGLGLASVHGIVTRNGGCISVDSEVGKGSAFTVYLPVAIATEPPTAAAPSVPVPHPETKTVLVVEDAEGLRALTRRLLERQGYTVLLAAEANEAIRIFEKNPSIDVLLTDVVMPGRSGPELVKQLVALQPALKVIYMSGYTDDAIVHHGVLNPGIAFLHKPFTSEALGQKLRDVLGS